MTPLRAYGYIRVSTALQAEKGFSIPEQEADIRAYCLRKGYHLCGLIYDAGESGRLEDRSGLVEVLERAAAGDYDVLVPVAIDRFGRDNRLILNATFAVQQAGLVVDYVEHGIASTPEQQMVHEMLGAIAGWEWAKIRARMMKGRLGKARNGQMPVRYAPYGYHQISMSEAAVLPEFRGRGGELVIVEEEAELVRTMYQLAAAGQSPWSITLQLNAAGQFNRKGHPWPLPTVKTILHRTAYRGVCYYNQVEHRITGERTKGGYKRYAHRPRALEEWIEIPCPVIVEEALWEQVQARLASSFQKPTGRPSLSWPLRGVVVCGACRGRYDQPLSCVGQRKTRNCKSSSYAVRYYQCVSRWYTNREFCGSRHDAEVLERQARDFLERIAQPGVLVDVARRQALSSRTSAREAEQAVIRWQKRVDDLSKQLLRLAGDLITAGFPPDIIREKVRQLDGNREEAQRQLSAALAAQNQMPKVDEAVARAEELQVRISAALGEAQGDVMRLQPIFQEAIRIYLCKAEARFEARI